MVKVIKEPKSQEVRIFLAGCCFPLFVFNLMLFGDYFIFKFLNCSH